MRRFRALDLRVDTKPDLTPVTDADLAAEESLRNVLRRARPRDAVLGEEFGRAGKGPRCWVIDPIDGTKNFVRGVPVWATLIGLMDGDQVVVGVVSAPTLGRRWWAARGGGAWTGRGLSKASPCRVSEVAKIEDASFSYSSLSGWEEQGRLQGFLGLTRSVWRTRGHGDLRVPCPGRRGGGRYFSGASRLPLGPRRPSGDRGRSWRDLHRSGRERHARRRQRRVHQRALPRRGARPSRRAHGLNPMGGGTRARGWHEPGPQGLPLGAVSPMLETTGCHKGTSSASPQAASGSWPSANQAPCGGRSVTSSSAAGSDRS